MQIYWTAKSIPELHDLPKQKRKAVWHLAWCRYWGSRDSLLSSLCLLAMWIVVLWASAQPPDARQRNWGFLIGFLCTYVVWNHLDHAIRRRVVLKILAKERETKTSARDLLDPCPRPPRVPMPLRAVVRRRGRRGAIPSRRSSRAEP